MYVCMCTVCLHKIMLTNPPQTHDTHSAVGQFISTQPQSSPCAPSSSKQFKTQYKQDRTKSWIMDRLIIVSLPDQILYLQQIWQSFKCHIFCDRAQSMWRTWATTHHSFQLLLIIPYWLIVDRITYVHSYSHTYMVLHYTNRPGSSKLLVCTSTDN